MSVKDLDINENEDVFRCDDIKICGNRYDVESDKAVSFIEKFSRCVTEYDIALVVFLYDPKRLLENKINILSLKDFIEKIYMTEKKIDYMIVDVRDAPKRPNMIWSEFIAFMEIMRPILSVLYLYSDKYIPKYLFKEVEIVFTVK
jgi:hypothetical protein